MLRLIILASMVLVVACGASEVSRALPATPGDVAARALVVPTEDEVPAVPMHEAASHGCVRNPEIFSVYIYNWIHLGDAIHVYN